MILRPHHAMATTLPVSVVILRELAGIKRASWHAQGSSCRQGASAVNEPSNLSPGCGNHGCAGGVCGRDVLPPLNAEVALLFLLGVSPKTPRKLFRLPSTLLLCTAGTPVMTTTVKLNPLI